MRTPVSGEVWVHYGQLYVQSGGEFEADLQASFAGQVNGVCGAGLPGFLWLVTGLHTGSVGMVVEVHDREPELDASWEDVVEVSFRPVTETVNLALWGGEGAYPLDLVVADYRVRYSAIGMDAGHAASAGGEVVDRYLLQFWPAAPESDRVVKQASQHAAYWHGHARGLPPADHFRQQREAEAQRERERVAAGERAMQRLLEEQFWGGPRPPGRSGQINEAAPTVRLDRSLAVAVVELDAPQQRDLARWVARRVFVEAQLADIDWIAAGLDALDAGRPLPPPWDEDVVAFNRMMSDSRVPRVLITLPDGQTDNALQQAAALPTLRAAADPDPARAVFNALHNAATAFGTRYPVLFEEIREKFVSNGPNSDGLTTA